MSIMQKFYAVKKGKKPGIYFTWNECKKQVSGYSGAQYKSFESEDEAKQYLNQTIKKDDIEIHTFENNRQQHHQDVTFQLTNEQKYAYQILLSGKNVFLTGGAGTGKSYVIHQFIHDMEAKDKKVLVCAPTGIAAINVGGVTIHRCFQASPEPQVKRTIKKVPKVIKESEIIIIDEISMCRIDLFDFIVRTLMKAEERCLTRKQLIVVGDFFQLPPVTTDNDRKVLEELYPEYKKGYAFESTNWQDMNFQMIELKEVKRQSNQEFINQLNKVRVGDISSVSYFNQYAAHQLKEDGIVLTATNKVADQINQRKLDEIPSKAKIYKSQVIGEVKPGDKPTLDELHLKVGARVMILINDAETNQYQNGSFGEIVKMYDDHVDICLDSHKQMISLGYYEWPIEDYVLRKSIVNEIEDHQLKKKKIGAFIQLPLKLAYAITMHKSQGQTYEKVNLIPYSFDCGQLYVALSRVKTLDGLCLVNVMRQENLICSEDVKKFYHIKDSHKQQEIIYQLGKKMLEIDENLFPVELQQIIYKAKDDLKNC